MIHPPLVPIILGYPFRGKLAVSFREGNVYSCLFGGENGSDRN